MESTHEHGAAKGEFADGADSGTDDNPKSIPIAEQGRFRDYAIGKVGELFGRINALYKETADGLGYGDEAGGLAPPHVEFKPHYARRNGTVNKAVVASYFKGGNKEESVPPNSIVVYLPAYDMFLNMEHVGSDAARRVEEELLITDIGHELGHELLRKLSELSLRKRLEQSYDKELGAALAEVLSPMMRGNQAIPEEANTRLNESLAQVIGVYAVASTLGKPTSNEALAKNMLEAVREDSVELESQYGTVLKALDSLSPDEKREEEIAVDSNERYMEVYALPRLGMAEALAANQDMPLPEFIGKAFAKPEDFADGIQQHVLDKNGRLSALRRSFEPPADLKGKAMALRDVATDTKVEAGYALKELEKS